MDIILASASIRRQELIKRLTNDFTVLVSDFDESTVEFKNDCAAYVMDIAQGKAQWVKNKVKNQALIIGCDTIVSFNGKVLGKPKSDEDAFNTLKMLSGNIHEVYSGLTLLDSFSGNIKKDFVCTRVKFSPLSDEEIKKYIETGEHKDKAGSYGIQGYGGIFVEEIHGCYYNVVGLPLNKLSKMLKGMGVNL
ncbi:Maf-like protein [Clostridium sp. P21]|uniref:dTTP/UTP pyrophosphatase n=1 Tax=Clostridium muellerianum TaxID=2716538 RepID=A0A7Y0HPS6_9CLOT|nr:Maf-like protein [Clostridium muellerianum]NMM64530.1 Maf-like protein [Clostridium muellerianum]